MEVEAAWNSSRKVARPPPNQKKQCRGETTIFQPETWGKIQEKHTALEMWRRARGTVEEEERHKQYQEKRSKAREAARKDKDESWERTAEEIQTLSKEGNTAAVHQRLRGFYKRRPDRREEDLLQDLDHFHNLLTQPQKLVAAPCQLSDGPSYQRRALVGWRRATGW